MIRRILSTQAIRYLLTGGISYIFEITILYVATSLLHIETAWAVTISFWLGFIFSFVIQRTVTFQDRSTTKKRILKQSLLYGALVCVNYAFTLTFVTLFEPIFGIIIARTVALVITTLWNFFAYKYIVFPAHASRLTDQKSKADLDFTQRLKATQPYLIKALFVVLIASPVVIFCLPMLQTGGGLFPGDFDMQIQMTEAAKTSILTYGQFPFWNPWISGGVPLFADPQFGLITPQTLLSLFMDSAMAWKWTILIYLIGGFLSLRALLRSLTPQLPSIATVFISYIWVFGGFFSLRSAGGHFTFLALTILPLAILLLLKAPTSKKHFWALVATIAFFINASLHYSTILTLLTLGAITLVWSGLDLLKALSKKATKPTLDITRLISITKPLWVYGAAAAIALIVTLPRLIPTLTYLNSNSVERTGARESFIGLGEGLRSLFLPYGSYASNNALTYGQFEANNYIGTLTGILLLLLSGVMIWRITRSPKARRFFTKTAKFPVIIASVGISFFVIGLGGLIFEGLRLLPVISSMRVSTRFFTITSLAILVSLAFVATVVLKQKIIGKYSHLIVTALIIIASLQVFVSGYRFQISTWTESQSLLNINVTSRSDKDAPHTDINWRDQPSPIDYYHALTAATEANRVQAVADNALVDTRSIATQRCDEDSVGCHYVLTDNALVVSWSPNEITLERTKAGEIRLNFNQGRGWLINGQKAFPDQMVVDSNSTFSIPASSDQIYRLTYSPY